MKALLIFIGIVAVTGTLFATDVLVLTTNRCTLPADLVFGDEICVFGSFGATLGMTLAATIVFGLISLVFAVLRGLFSGATPSD